jgi:hypothetical protein
MTDRNLGANSLSIRLADTPHEAPKYNKPEYLFANLVAAQIVGRGTVAGNPTVDFIFEDENGQKYVAMLTGGIVENLAAAVLGMKQRTADQNRAGH